MDDPAAVTRLFGYVPSGAGAQVTVGSGNWNFRLETARGESLFVRKHWPGVLRERLEQEHRLVNWVGANGIPVAVPLRTVEGESVVEVEEALWAVFPWVHGMTTVRGQLTASQVFAAGEMHGRIHRALLDYPERVEDAPPVAFDVERAARHLSRVIAAAREQRAERWVVDGLEFQLDQLRRHGNEPTEAGLTRSLSHGDYHDQQLIFAGGGRIAAVTDWEMFGLRPRAWEVVRSLYLSQLMEGPHMERYVAGYLDHMTLPEEERRLAMHLWWQGCLHNAWVFRAYFLEGNARASEYFSETLRALRAISDDRARGELTERFARAGG